MNDENWSRSYRITFGTAAYTVEETFFEITNFVANTVETAKIGVDSTTVPSRAIKMSNLTSDGESRRGFDFSLDTTRGSSQSVGSGETTTIELWNLNEEVLEVLNLPDCIIQVELGYGEEVTMAYAGDVMKVKPQVRGNDVVYKLTCKDGGRAFENTAGTIDYDENVSEKDVVVDMISRFPDAVIGTNGTENLNTSYQTGGFTFMGKLSRNVEKMLVRNNLSCYRYNGKMGVIPYRLNEGTTDYEEFAKTNYNFTEDNLHTIEPTSDNGDKLSGDNKVKSGVTITAFFTPIELGQFFTIPTISNYEEYAGTYLVTRVRIRASRSGSFHVAITGESIS